MPNNIMFLPDTLPITPDLSGVVCKKTAHSLSFTDRSKRRRNFATNATSLECESVHRTGPQREIRTFPPHGQFPSLFTWCRAFSPYYDRRLPVNNIK